MKRERSVRSKNGSMYAEVVSQTATGRQEFVSDYFTDVLSVQTGFVARTDLVKVNSRSL